MNSSDESDSFYTILEAEILVAVLNWQELVRVNAIVGVCLNSPHKNKA